MSRELNLTVEDCTNCPVSRFVNFKNGYMCKHPNGQFRISGEMLEDGSKFKDFPDTCPLPKEEIVISSTVNKAANRIEE